MKKTVCIVITAIILLSLSGCSDLFGAVFLSAVVAQGDDRAKKEDIFSFVIEHEEELLQAIEENDVSHFENSGIVISVSVNTSAVVFYCGGVGMTPSSTYVGFFYSPQDDMTAFYPSVSEGLIPSGDGFLWKEEGGDNRFYTEKICNCFYYYEESY